jgi:predicted amidohydrolase
VSTAPVRVAAVQMTSGGDVGANLDVARALVAEAAEAGARLVVLPENFALMAPDDASRRRAAEDEGRGPIQEAASSWARRHRLWLVAGTIPVRTADDPRPQAVSFVYGPDGALRGRYAKIHLFDVDLAEESHRESRGIAPGARPLVVTTDMGALAVAVCYDLRFPELFRLTAGVELVALPAAFTVPTGRAHWEILVRARAIENQCTLVAAAQGGVHPPGGRRTWGRSMIVDAWGRILAERAEGAGTVVAEHDPEALAEIRRRLPALEHRRLRVLPPPAD